MQCSLDLQDLEEVELDECSISHLSDPVMIDIELPQ